MDEVTWTALTAVLTALGAVWTVHAFRNRGTASGLRGAGLTLLPPAAWLTGTLEMFTEIGGSVFDWATGLVLSPAVWAGVVLAGLSVMLLGTSAAMRNRGHGQPRRRRSEPPAAPDPRPSAQLPSAKKQGDPLLDDDMADIEEILKRRGIS